MNGHTVLAAVGLQFEARIVAGPGIRTLCLGPHAPALHTAVIPGDRGIISFGICGGLAPRLRPGTCIVASTVWHGAHVWPADANWSKRLLRTIAGSVSAPLAGCAEPVLDPTDKRNLHAETGAAAVDTESHLVAAAASAHRLPFVAVRVIADDAHCRLPAVALAGRRTDGSIDRLAVLRALAANPAEAPALARVAAQARAARVTLLRVRRRLGADLGLAELV
jgi:hopanoid-associated phosphorylase